MIAALGSFRPVFLSALLMMMCQGIMGTVLPVRLAQLEAPAQLAGLVTTFYFVGQVFGTRLGHRLLARAGHIRAFAATISATAVCVLLVPMIAEPFAWIALRFLMGFCAVLSILVLESWLNISVDNTNRGSVFGIYMVIVYIGLTSGQFSLGFFDAGSFAVFSAAAMALMISILPMTLTERLQPELPPAERLGLLALYKVSPVGIAACVTSGALMSAVYGLFPYFATSSGMAPSDVAVFMTGVIGGGLVLNWPVGRLSDFVDRRIVIAAMTIVIAGCSISLLLDKPDLLRLVIIGALIGGASSGLYSLGVAHTNDYVGGSDAIAVGSGLLLAFSTGAIGGPLIAGALMDLTSPGMVFAYTASVAAALCLLAILRIFAKKPVAPEEKVDFVPLPRTTPVAYSLDPWAGDESQGGQDDAGQTHQS